MNTIEEYLNNIEAPDQKARLLEVFQWIGEKYPSLESKIAWNQPMFTDHGTFIIGFSISKKHMAVAPEAVGIERFTNEIIESGYEHTNQIIRMPWNKEVNYHLLAHIIDFNIEDKTACTTFWR